MQIEFGNSANYSNIPEHCIGNIDPTQRAWIEVSGSSIENNVRYLKSFLKRNCKFMAVVKADGYGHDAKFVSKHAIIGGADQLGVATLQEGINLRLSGINVPILVLSNIYSKEDLNTCFQYELMPTISSLRECLICNNIGKKYKRKFPIHLKVDTGMARLGFDINEFLSKLNKIKSCSFITIDGIYSHLSSADEDNALDKESFTQIQRRRFEELLLKINLDNYSGIKFHLANSAGTLLGKDFHFDMVRVGLSMYGYNPIKNKEKEFIFKPALFLKSKVSFIRTINKNVGVSYGRKFISDRKTKIAVISIGYADGISRKLSNLISIIHNGKIYSQVGSITMDQLMIDITDSNDIKVGSTICLLGSEGEVSISPLEWADKCSSIPWEILCAFKNRLPRVQIP